MRERNDGSIQGEQTMREVFARISLQLANFNGVLQEMRLSRQRTLTSPELIPAATGRDMQGFPACRGSEGRGNVW
jgi:hypothetical protein